MDSMLRYHMAVVTPDKRLKRAIKRVTAATASNATFVKELAEVPEDPPVDMAILDARESTPTEKQLEQLSENVSIAYILDEENLISTVDMLTDSRVSSLLCHNDTFDDDEFIASVTKALRGDVFGLQKYFPWGVTTYSMVISSYQEKTEAISIIYDYAREAGLRGPVRDRIQLVSDELMMNALYHAPVDEDGQEMFRHVSRKDLAKLAKVPAIEVQYGCSGRYFGLSIRDSGGSLTREKTLQYLMRAKNATAQIETKETGAGLGLISVLRSVSKLIFNLEPGHSTEVIALFDMNLFGQGKVGAHSLGIFLANNNEQEHESNDDLDAVGSSAARTPVPVSRWATVALMLALIAVALGVSSVLRDSRSSDETAQVAPRTISVTPTPADAAIRLNGVPLQAGEPVPIPARADTYDVSVTKTGYRPWTKKLTSTDVQGAVQLFVHLQR